MSANTKRYCLDYHGTCMFQTSPNNLCIDYSLSSKKRESRTLVNFQLSSWSYSLCGWAECCIHAGLLLPSVYTATNLACLCCSTSFYNKCTQSFVILGAKAKIMVMLLFQIWLSIERSFSAAHRIKTVFSLQKIDPILWSWPMTDLRPCYWPRHGINLSAEQQNVKKILPKNVGENLSKLF